MRHRPIAEGILLLSAIALYSYTFLAPWGGVRRVGDIGPAYYPRLLLLGIIIGGAFIVFVSREWVTPSREEVGSTVKNVILSLAYPLSIVAFMFSVWYVGLATSIAVFLIAWMLAFGVRRPTFLIAIPLSIALFVFVLFRLGGVFLPRGWLI